MGTLSWESERGDWPNHGASRFVTAAGLNWHVQRAGSGPPLLLVHGTGASTHSWRDLLPRLSRNFDVIAPDLPGHGFTSPPTAMAQQSLPAMAEALAGLLQHLEFTPQWVVGHSAGAALLARLAIDGRIQPQKIVSLNGAFQPYGGAAFQLLKPVTRAVASSNFVAALLAQRGRDPQTIRRLIERTGSTLDKRGLDLYARLVSSSGHVAGALTMMAEWDLRPLLHDLPRLRVPLVLVVGTADRTIPEADAERVRLIVPQARLLRLWGLGHLAHEERPQLVSQMIFELTHEPENRW